MTDVIQTMLIFVLLVVIWIDSKRIQELEETIEMLNRKSVWRMRR